MTASRPLDEAMNAYDNARDNYNHLCSAIVTVLDLYKDVLLLPESVRKDLDKAAQLRDAREQAWEKYKAAYQDTLNTKAGA